MCERDKQLVVISVRGAAPAKTNRLVHNAAAAIYTGGVPETMRMEKKKHKVKVFEEAENENVEVMEGQLPLKKKECRRSETLIKQRTTAAIRLWGGVVGGLGGWGRGLGVQTFTQRELIALLLLSNTRTRTYLEGWRAEGGGRGRRGRVEERKSG